MENQLQIFSNDDFGEIRTTTLNGEIAFLAADACRALEIKNHRDAIANFDDDEKGTSIVGTLGGEQKMLVVTEYGLYRLVFMSRKPNAKAFRRWIWHEVIPSIRKTGAYVSLNAAITPDFLRKIADELEQAHRKVSQLEGKVAELAPKASSYDTIINCKDLLSTTQIAKDYGMSPTKFNRLLNQLAIQFRRGDKWFLYQKYAELGWAATKTQTYNGSDGAVHSKAHMYWTQKGRLGLYDLLKTYGYYPTTEQPTLLD